MKIRVGKYILRSDSFCYWIEEEYVGEDKKGREKAATKRIAGYASSLGNLLQQFIDYKVKSSDAESMDELAECIQKICDDVEMLRDVALDYGFTFERVKGKDNEEEEF